MDRALHDFLILNLIFAAVNTILMGLLVWQLWVVRSRVDRFESFVGRIGNGVRGVAHRVGGLVQQIGRAVERATMGR
jgi:hypothetical protein